MKLTSKGQVTVPQHVREKLGLFPGTEIEFVVKGKRYTLLTRYPRRVRRYFPSVDLIAP